MDSGVETINDREERQELRKQARKVHVQSLLFAIALTALVVIAPGPN
jgi:hypothetical protein